MMAQQSGLAAVGDFILQFGLVILPVTSAFFCPIPGHGRFQPAAPLN